MRPITIHSLSHAGVTVIPNSFLDDYMPQANGEFVKIYLFLLRAQSSSESFDLTVAADRLNCTERDIVRALKYWEKAGLLSLTLDSSENVSDIYFLNMPDRTPSAAAKEEEEASKPEESPEAVSPVKKAPEKVRITPDRIKELKKNEDIVQLLYIAEQYLGRPLTATDTNTIFYFYDQLEMSADLIEYLIEYCVSKGSRSIRYIEKVALGWHEDGITTVSMAKQSTTTYHKDYFTIMRALGIKNRNPVSLEISMMNTWLKEYGFTLDIIEEACTRTVLQTGQPSMQYTDKILLDWQKHGIKHKKDIEALDHAHKNRKKNVKEEPPKSASNNRFNNFHQREYDFDEYEKKLLNQ